MVLDFDTDLEAAAWELNTISAWDLNVSYLGRIWAVRMPTIPELLDCCNLKGESSEVLWAIFDRSLFAWTGMPLTVAQSVDRGKLCRFIKIIAFRMAKRMNMQIVDMPNPAAAEAKGLVGTNLN
jgi:hypothetical protein